MITRRRFLQASAATGALLAWPIRAFPFSQSVLPILKFKVALPGLIADTASSATHRGVPVLTKVSAGTPNGSPDVYKISARGFTQKLLEGASTLNPDVKLWGYASDAPGAGIPQYLGGVIVATGGKNPIPVELDITNSLPDKTILPVDTTLIDPASGEIAFAKRVDRIAVHLHGGLVFWAYDGGPFHWFSSATNFVHGSSFINGPLTGTGVGTATYLYPNQQSARFLWYHDHAYGLTRTNAYAGLASAYLITDAIGDGGEMDLIESGAIPGKGLDAFTGLLGIPLVVQDKTFWNPASNDPTYTSAVPGAVEGDLWYPHKYEGGLDPEGLADMALAPVSPLVPARWGTPIPSVSNNLANSSVPEYFSDTILVNGAPYPTLTVDPKRYRFRFLDASQGRFYNLQLYVANPASKDGITLIADPAGDTDPNGNPILIPDPTVNPPGPAFVQIANEAGFLKELAVLSTLPDTNLNSNTVLRYKISAAARKLHRVADDGRLLKFGGDRLLFSALPGDPTVGNVIEKNLLMAPAERPDVIIDFRGTNWPAGTEFILYNDAPAPFPGGDTRNDYFVVPDPAAAGLPAGWSNDLRPIGGAPPPVTGEGPDTRVLMKFILSDKAASTEPPFATWVGTLKTALHDAFLATQDPQPIPGAPGRTLVKTLGEDNDEFGRLRQFLGTPSGNLRTYLDFPSDVAVEDEVQTWEVYNLTADTHPMHFHLVNVQVLRRQGWLFNGDGTPVLPLQPDPASPVTQPDANEMGWKETVRMNPGEVTTVQMKFTLPKGTAPKNSPRLLASYGINGAEYVWHCHILEHEEHDMMHALVVVPK